MFIKCVACCYVCQSERRPRFFVGLTPGYFNPNLTAEDIAANWDTIRDETGYIVPDDNTGELSKILNTLKSNS
jgi:hypothetical protein